MTCLGQPQTLEQWSGFSLLPSPKVCTLEVLGSNLYKYLNCGTLIFASVPLPLFFRVPT